MLPLPPEEGGEESEGEREREKKIDKRRVGQDEEGGREERREWELRTIPKTHAGKVSE